MQGGVAWRGNPFSRDPASTTNGLVRSFQRSSIESLQLHSDELRGIDMFVPPKRAILAFGGLASLAALLHRQKGLPEKSPNLHPRLRQRVFNMHSKCFDVKMAKSY